MFLHESDLAPCAATNNGSTGHFQLLLAHTAQLLERRDNLQAAANALHLCQVALKFAAEHLTTERMLLLVLGPSAGGVVCLQVAWRRGKEPDATFLVHSCSQSPLRATVRWHA